MDYQNPREYSVQQQLLRLQINLKVSVSGSNKGWLIVRNLLAMSQMEWIPHGIRDICVAITIAHLPSS
jgi:hypothetical protein